MGNPNEELLRKGYAAFSSGDMDTIKGLLASDIIWHVGGKNTISGDYKGIDEVIGFFGKVVGETAGTLKLEVHDVIANDEHVIVLTNGSGTRNGKSYQDQGVAIYHVKDGKATEAWFTSTDPYKLDEVWA